MDWAFLAGAPAKLVEDRRHLTGGDPLLLAAGLTRCPRLSTLHVRGAQAFPLDAALRVCGHRLTTLNLGGVSAPHGFWLRALAGCPMLYAVAGALNASSDEFCRALGKHCARLKRVRFQCCAREFFAFLGDDAAVPAPSGGEESAPPRCGAGVASMAWRSTRIFKAP